MQSFKSRAPRMQAGFTSQASPEHVTYAWWLYVLSRQGLRVGPSLEELTAYYFSSVNSPFVI